MASAVIGALRVNLSADTAEFRKNLNTAEKAAQAFGRQVGSSVKGQLIAFAGAAAAAAGPAALGLLLKTSVETISAQVDLARRVGASVAAIQTLEYATTLAGGSAEGLGKVLGILNARLGEAAREGAGPAYEALQRLGLSAQELSKMDADERIKALSDRMAELGLTTQQQADTLKQFGVRNQEIINLFQEGSEAINKSRAELQSWGVLLSDVDASKVEAAGDQWDRMWTILKGVGNQLAVRLAPAMEEFVNWLGRIAAEGKLANQAVNIFDGLLQDFGEEIARETYLMEAFVSKLTLAKKVIESFRIGKEGGVDWEMFNKAQADSANEIAAAWGRLEAHLNNINPLVQSLDGYIKNLTQPDKLTNSLDNYIAQMKKRMGVGEGDDGETEADKKEREKADAKLKREQEARDAKLAALKEDLMTERELELANYEQRLLDLKDFHDRGMLSDQEYNDLILRSKQEYGDKIKEIDDDIARNAQRNAELQQRAAFDTVDNVLSAFESLFGDSKALAIAHAIINTAQAVTKTLAEYGATPWGLAAAAAAAVAGAAEIATIRSTSKSGGSGGKSSRGSSAAAAASTAPVAPQNPQVGSQQTIFVSGIKPNQIFTGNQLIELVNQLKDLQRDGTKIVLDT